MPHVKTLLAMCLLALLIVVAGWYGGSGSAALAAAEILQGERADESGMPTEQPSIEFVAISAGLEHTCGLLSSGTVLCWGNDAGQGRTQPPGGTFR